MKGLATVVIPARNEAPTIGRVVQTARQARWVDEVIVVDGYSTDGTILEARKAGARVVMQSRRGYPAKGIAMRDGLRAASNAVIAYVDADIVNIGPEMIEQLIEPVIKDEADFVKGTFERVEGRVTELVAKPLLKMFFPELAGFSQPLSGEIAGRRWVFEQIKFEENWGVDVGILIDVLRLGVRIKEVHIGFKDHIMKPLLDLQEMAYQVAEAILKRAEAERALKDIGWVTRSTSKISYHEEKIGRA